MKHLLIHVKNEKTGSYQTITAVAFVVNLLFFGFFLLFPSKIYFGMGALTAMLLYVLVRAIQKRRRPGIPFFDSYGVVFLIMAFWWTLLDKVLVAVLTVLLGALYHFSMKATTILFTPAGIEIASPFKRTFQWSQFENIVLKDGFLTLDFKNNKLLQVKVREKLNEQEVNQFFKYHLFADTLNQY